MKRRQTLKEQLAAVTAERDAWKAIAEMLAARPQFLPFAAPPVQTPFIPSPSCPQPVIIPSIPFDPYTPTWGIITCTSTAKGDA